MASSTIMYKFRSSTTFEALPMPGTSARLFDVKRAIVTAKKLDRSGGGHGLEFDLSVRNAMTNEEYDDETILLPRGTRVVVQRLPAARGHGLLSKIARVDAGLTFGIGGIGSRQKLGSSQTSKSTFYNIDSTKRDEEDEFIMNVKQVQPLHPNEATALPHFPEDHWTKDEVKEEEKELAEMRVVTDAVVSNYSSSNAFSRNVSGKKIGTKPRATIMPPVIGAPGSSTRNTYHYFTKPPAHLIRHPLPKDRPNADPEVREQDARITLASQPKKRATGIPRTFLNHSVPGHSVNDPKTENDLDDLNISGTESGGLARLQPNVIGFQALIHHGGGQSESHSDNNSRSLEYALKLTASTVPDYLQCGICHHVVKNAMLLPWDSEGRTTCESCIRDNLSQNGFRCPLTGQEGVSPDDLLPNHGLRKAADLFVKCVMEKMNEIVELREQEDKEEEVKNEYSVSGIVRNHINNPATLKKNFFYNCDNDLEKGVVISGKASVRKKIHDKIQEEEDPFGDDEFGRDVFDVSHDRKVDKKSDGYRGALNVTYVAKVKNLDANINVNVEAEFSNNATTNENNISTNNNMEENDISYPKIVVNSRTSVKPDKKDVIKYNHSDRCDDSVEFVSKDFMKEKNEIKDISANSPTFRLSNNISKTVFTKNKVIKLSPAKNVHNRKENILKICGPPPGYVVGPAGCMHRPLSLHYSSSIPVNHSLNEIVPKLSSTAPSCISERVILGGRSGNGLIRGRSYHNGRCLKSGFSRNGTNGTNIISDINNAHSKKEVIECRNGLYDEQKGGRSVRGRSEGNCYHNQQYRKNFNSRGSWKGRIYHYPNYIGRGMGTNMFSPKSSATGRGNEYPNHMKYIFIYT